MKYSELLRVQDGPKSDPDMDEYVAEFLSRVIPRDENGNPDKQEAANLIAESINATICAMMGKRVPDGRLGDFCVKILLALQEQTAKRELPLGFMILKELLLKAEVSEIITKALKL